MWFVVFDSKHLPVVTITTQMVSFVTGSKVPTRGVCLSFPDCDSVTNTPPAASLYGCEALGRVGCISILRLYHWRTSSLLFLPRTPHPVTSAAASTILMFSNRTCIPVLALPFDRAIY